MQKDSLTMEEALAGFPCLSLAIVEALEQAFPNKLPATKTSPEDLAFLQGQQTVVQFLRAKYEEQTYNFDNKPVILY